MGVRKNRRERVDIYRGREEEGGDDVEGYKNKFNNNVIISRISVNGLLFVFNWI